MRLVEELQRNEYLRYAHDLRRRKGRAEVISGTAGLFPVAVLREVAGNRGRLLPHAEFVYAHRAWTEDNELTTAVKHLGYRCASPSACTVQTELMPTAPALYYQRLRWQRGALDTLRTYGANSTTMPYIVRQALIHIGIFFFPFFFAVLTITTLQTGLFPWSWPWFFVSSIVVVERVWTVRAGGARAVGLAVLVLPEVLYDLFLHTVFIRAMMDSITRSGGHWDHAEATRHARGQLARTWRVIGQVAITVIFIGGAVVAAFLTILAGIHWAVVGVIVGAGIAHSALRASMLDPLGFILGSGEHPSGEGRHRRTRLRELTSAPAPGWLGGPRPARG